jgi:monothiol glutaredoxin
MNRVDEIVKSNDVVLFMKGTKFSPNCGFSAFSSSLLNNLNIEYKDINVLEDEEIRSFVKKYSNWSTIPQLYIKGEFIGGCDIMRDMYNSGEFLELLDEKNISYKIS